LDQIFSTQNKATQILDLQSQTLRELNEKALISVDNYTALEDKINDLMNQQGQCEHIKNTPYPRQFTSINLYFTILLCVFLPLGFIGAFSPLMEDYGSHIIWLTVPISIVIGWVFLVLEQIGESTENPFEGNANDVPITKISQDIKINLKEMLGEKNIPPEIKPEENNILM